MISARRHKRYNISDKIKTTFQFAFKGYSNKYEGKLKDFSRSGIGFTTNYIKLLHMGDELIVGYSYVKNKLTMHHVRVVRIDGYTCGCEIIETKKRYIKE